MSLQHVVSRGWGAFRARQMVSAYRRRRDAYAAVALARGLSYSEERVSESIRSRLVGRGYAPRRKPSGAIHTFAFVPDMGWHRMLLPDIHLLGPATVFDYAALGFEWRRFWRADRKGLSERARMNELLFETLVRAHRKNPVDWVFVYGTGVEISAGTMRQITRELGIPSVNMCLDDKQSWVGGWMGDHRGGQIDIASAFDLSWTSARVACDWYLVEDARPIYMPEGFDASSCTPMNLERDLAISFIGAAYGFRPALIKSLRRAGIDVAVYGPEWGTRSVWGAEQVSIFNRSRINLGMGGIGYSEELTNVKTRDFEIPGTGGGVYLTSFNSDLASHFAVGQEILCYRHTDELIELCRYYAKHDDEARLISEKARTRCLLEHRWLHRYEKVCRILGILEDPTKERVAVTRDTERTPTRASE